MGEPPNQPFQLSCNGSLKVDFQGSRVTSDGGLLLVREWDARWGRGARIVPYLPDARRGKNTPLPLADLSGRKREGREGGLSNGLHRRPWLGVPYPEEAGRALMWAAGVAREGKEEKPAPTEAVVCILTAGREGTMAILAT
jgi:hypothetical protein